jgi:phosphoglycolate phosphatase-like HAD superfamily hydrolase
LRRLGAADDLDEMLAEFLVYYGANVAQESRPYPGAVTALKRCKAGPWSPKRHDQARGWRPILGDSDVDVQTAKAAGVPVILVSFGYALLANLEAEATIDHFDQLDVCAATLLAAKTRRSAPS